DSEKIAVAVAEPGGEVRSLGRIPNREDSVRGLVKKLGPASGLRVCDEAGRHGYGLYWQLSKLGVQCDVVAPTLEPVKSGDRVKSWTTKHLLWVKTLRFEHAAQEATFLDYVHEVEHAAARVTRLEQAIDQAIEEAPPEMRALIAGLQALRGIRRVSAATIVAE